MTSRSSKSTKSASSFKVKIIITITKESEASTQTLKSSKPVTNTEMKCYWCDKPGYIASECSQKKAETKMLEETDDMSFDESNESNSNILDLKNK